MTASTDDLTALLFDDAIAGKPDPMTVFAAWLDAARLSEPNDPGAMTLATVDEAGAPDARMVLLNGLDDRGFVFFTNLESAKASQLAASANAALVFHWKSLRRQVRVRGPVAPVADAEADAYFATRPRAARIGAHASAQSRPLAGRAALVAATEAVERRFAGAEVPRPAHWSGFRLAPLAVEFWKDGEARLHDRLAYRRPAPGAPWTTTRLNP